MVVVGFLVLVVVRAVAVLADLPLPEDNALPPKKAPSAMAMITRPTTACRGGG